MAQGFNRIKEYVDADLNGQSFFSTFRKVPTQVTTTGVWFDLSMSPGNPLPKYWFDATPLTATIVRQSTDVGIRHGADCSPLYKYLARTTFLTATATPLPMPIIVCDYLLYYPTIDEGTTDVQTMINTNTLTRYTDGKGVQAIAISVASRAGGQSFSINYTNSDGVAGRVSQSVVQNGNAVIGSIVNTAPATLGTSSPFIPLQQGDIGIRSIQSVTMNGIDVGLFSIVLVKPLETTLIKDITAPIEKNYLIDSGQVSRIYDDAFLGALCLPQGSLNAVQILGDITTIWN